jgi:hypothetical protein
MLLQYNIKTSMPVYLNKQALHWIFFNNLQASSYYIYHLFSILKLCIILIEGICFTWFSKKTVASFHFIFIVIPQILLALERCNVVPVTNEIIL